MRSHTSLRTAFRFGMMMAVSAGVTFAASQAHADVSTGSSGPNTSTGTAALKFDYNNKLETSIRIPETGTFGPSVAKFHADVTIEPVKNGGPLYSIDMPKGAVVQASWAGDKKIVLKAADGSQTDGTVKVRHTIAPTLFLDVTIPVIGTVVNLNFDATKYVNDLPGARFAFDSRATQQFAPWGFTKVDTHLNAPDLASSVLFSEPLSIFGSVLDPAQWDGTLGIRATTKPTFSYQTTKVMLSGSNTPITTGAGESVIDAIDGDFMEVMAQVEGQMSVAGTLDFQPFISITKALGYNFGTTIAINAYSKAYTTPPSKVAYQAALVHIPLPNVHAPKQGVDLGDVKAGGSATKTVTIENSGEQAAVMTFKSSDPAFAVPGGSITVEPKGKYEMQVKFAANNAGPAQSDITVLSNDPDSPEQTFKIGANGADVGGPTNEKTNLPGSSPSGDSGCGCKTAGSTTSTGGWASIGLLGLGALVLVRRRRDKAAA